MTNYGTHAAAGTLQLPPLQRMISNNHSMRGFVTTNETADMEELGELNMAVISSLNLNKTKFPVAQSVMASGTLKIAKRRSQETSYKASWPRLDSLHILWL